MQWVTWCYMCLLAIWGQQRSMRDEWFHIINHCLLPRLPFPPPTVLPCSPLPPTSNLQPPCFSGSYFYCWPSHQPSILFRDCGFLSPATPAFLSYPPLCPLLIIIKGIWLFCSFFFSNNGVNWEVELFQLQQHQTKEIRMVGNLCLLSSPSSCVCVCTVCMRV